MYILDSSTSWTVRDGSEAISPLRRANASSGVTSNVHGGLYVSNCLMLEVAMQLFGFPGIGFGHPSIVRVGVGVGVVVVEVVDGERSSSAHDGREVEESRRVDATTPDKNADLSNENN